MNITEHFSLEELCFSEVASRLGLDNIPTALVVANLKLVAVAMEKVRALLGNEPILVHSGYRSPLVNKAVGGVETSTHCMGLACDFVCPTFGSPSIVASAIAKSDIEYDQLILEYGWVHMGIVAEGRVARHEALTKRSSFDPYESGIRA